MSPGEDTEKYEHTPRNIQEISSRVNDTKQILSDFRVGLTVY